MFSFKETVKKHKDEYMKALESVLESGIGMLGPKVCELEKQLSNYTGTKNVICCQSGTFALSLALKALDIKPGDEIITTPFTWISSTSTIVHSGAKPVFVDIELSDYNIDVSNIEEKITSKTKAILIVNIFGKLINNIDKLLELKDKYKLFIIEDAAQSFGAFDKKYKSCDGKIGDICCTSFYPTKPLCGFGDGGACFTNNDVFAERLKKIRNHGMSSYGEIEYLGWNARMNEFQAAIILINLSNFNEKSMNRKAIAYRYETKISIECVKPKLSEGHMVAQYSIMMKDRESFMDYLKENKIACKIFYHKSMFEHDLFKKYKNDSFPNTSYVTKHILSIPCYDGMSVEEVDRIISIINKYTY